MSYWKKSTEKLDGGPHSVLRPGQFVGFETVFVKPEKEEQSLICEGNPLDATFEIKEEFIEDEEADTDQKYDEKYETKLHTTHTGEANIYRPPRRLHRRKKQQNQESEQEQKYTCEKCARTYKNKAHLNRHQKFECGVIPQFRCEFCDKRFKRNVHLRQHIVRVHDKTNVKASQTKYNCDKCSRSYSSSDALTFHTRLEHAADKPQFICDICGFKTKLKPSLSRHILAQHLGCSRAKHRKRSFQN
ncbi:zinc finger protein 888-like [Belonocnema kinseyi]|uniref:zinc finger protein 888-like n=1 Tax=Belonocnema kinseyi TaxID=2817044 RepID=UPI00143DBCD9|nr:zinc finger protein 888-like [Belonocnema kinseyi]